MKLLASMLCVTLISTSAQAQKVYRVVQPDGTVEFTDSPPSNRPAEEIHIRPLNSTPGLAPAPTTSAQPASDKGYSDFRITSPRNEDAIRDNAGNVNVDLKLTPSLKSGDKIALLLDGQSVGGGRATAITLSNMDRGTHNLQAVVKNSTGQVVARSNSVTFTVQRRSAILQPAPPRAVPFHGGGRAF